MKKRLFALISAILFVQAQIIYPDEENSAFAASYMGYSKMMSDFFADSTYSLYGLADLDHSNVPDEYAGAYYGLNGDNSVTVFLTDLSHQDVYEEWIPNAKFQEVSFSYDYLLHVWDALTQAMEYLDIASVRLSEKENCVIVSCSYADSVNKLIKSLGISVDAIRFEAYSEISHTSSYAYSGTILKNGSTGNRVGTIGYNAYKPQTGQYGIVTAGHVITNTAGTNSPYLTFTGSTINTKDNAVYQSNGNLDAAFIPFGSTNWVQTPIYFSGATASRGNIIGYEYVTSYLCGTTVQKYGNETLAQSGVVLESVCSISVGDKIYTDFVHCSNYNDLGDSGGPIGVEVYQSGYKLDLIGITSCKDNSDSSTYACKITNICSGLGVVPCT